LTRWGKYYNIYKTEKAPGDILRGREPNMAKKGEKPEERKEAEEALRESEEKYRNIFETAPDGIVTVNLKGIVTSCKGHPKIRKAVQLRHKGKGTKTV